MPVYAGSHRKQAGNLVGALGDIVFEHFLRGHGIPFASRYTTTDDLEIFGATADVKTKDRTVTPEPHHECSAPPYNHEPQRPDFHVFVSLYRDRDPTTAGLARLSHACLLGWPSIRQVDDGRRWEAGDVDPENGTRFWTACLNIAVRDLRPPDILVARARARLDANPIRQTGGPLSLNSIVALPPKLARHPDKNDLPGYWNDGSARPEEAKGSQRRTANMRPNAAIGGPSKIRTCNLRIMSPLL